MNYRREIDGLRAVAVIPVVLFHAGFSAFSGGYIGVDVFFVISGYLITTLIISERQSGSFTLLRFYERRARRILPALFFVMSLCIPFAWLWLMPAERKAFFESLGAMAVFSSNILFWHESDYFAPAAELKPLLHTWSLAVEEQYYVLFPLFLAGVWRFGKRWTVAFLAALALASFATAMWAVQTHPAFAFYLLPARGWEIFAGALLAFFLEEYGETLRSRGISQLPSLFGLLLIAFAAIAFDRYMPYPSQYTLVPAIGTALIIVFATPDTFTGKLLGSRLLVGIGLISYSVYLWHQPLFAFARNYCLDEPGKLLMTALAVAALFLGGLSWKFVESPFRRKQGFSRRQLFISGTCFSAIFILLALSGELTDGFATASEQLLAYYARYPHEQFDREGLCLLKADQTYTDFSAQCVPANSAGGTLIWGDSYAGTLSYGLRQLLPGLIQYTAGGCPPVKDMDIAFSGHCRAVNDFVMHQIERIQPGRVFLHAHWTVYSAEGLLENLRRTIGYIHDASPSTEITIVGALPLWRPSLPAAMARGRIAMSKDLFLRSAGFDELSASDDALRAVATENHAHFYSALTALCQQDKCQATTVLDGTTMLTAYDFGHLTAGGSVLLAQRMLAR
jgi:peptidoglycan/LPS O-acetylase OafA/YrhL